MPRPRILVVIKGLGIGGAERLLSDGAEYWDRERFDYHVAYVVPWKTELVPEFERLGIPVRCVGGRGSLVGIAWRLRTLMRTWDINVVHTHSPSVAAIARVVAGSRPLIHTEHNVVGSYRRLTQLINRATYRRNASVMAVSEAVADSLNAYGGPTPEVVVNGVSARTDPESAHAARVELGIDGETPLVVHVGNIRPHKGHSNLIAAVALLAESHPGVVVVSIGGEKHEGDLARVRQEAAAAGIEASLRFLGRRSDARAFVEAADVYVNPSDFEGLPVSILEAMALERPVVATAVGGVASIINPSTGILVSAREPRALASAIGDLLDDRDRAAELAKSARALVDSDFGLERMVRQIEEHYEAVIDV